MSQRDLVAVYFERVPMENGGIEEGRKQVVRGSDRVYITREVEVHVLHRHDLAAATARAPTLDAEDRAERGLPQRDHSLLPDVVHALSEADRRGRLAFAQRGGRNGCYYHVLCIRQTFAALDNVEVDLGL